MANGGERIAAVLEQQGVRFIFTLCGGHISPILVSCKARGIRVVDVRDEANAVFAADGVARLTGVPGVAAVTAGPGVTNTLTAVKNAQMAQSPVVLLGGAAATMLKGRGALQDIDQMAVIRSHVKWACTVDSLKDLAPAVTEAFDRARSGVPGPVFVECPIDLLYDESLVRQWYVDTAGKGPAKSLGQRAMRWYLNRHVGRLFSNALWSGPPPSEPQRTSEPLSVLVSRAASMIERAERPVLLVGSQTLSDARQADEIADAVKSLGMPTWLAGMARGLLGHKHDLHMRHKRRNALKEADLVILAGVPADFRLDYGRVINRKARVISANLSWRQLFKNHIPSLPVPADPGRFLICLAAACQASESSWPGWQATLQERDDARDAEIAEMGKQDVSPMNPLKVCQAVEDAMSEDSVIVADGGDFVATASYIVRPRGPLCWLDPGVFGTLGVGAGFALAAALCRPDAEVWLIYGDGAAGFSLVEFDTFARHGLPVIAVIGNDAGWTQIARDQVVFLEDDVATVLARSEYEKVAEGFGGVGLSVRQETELADVMTRAREAAAEGKPVLINAHIGTTDFRKGSISM